MSGSKSLVAGLQGTNIFEQGNQPRPMSSVSGRPGFKGTKIKQSHRRLKSAVPGGRAP